MSREVGRDQERTLLKCTKTLKGTEGIDATSLFELVPRSKIRGHTAEV